MLFEFEVKTALSDSKALSLQQRGLFTAALSEWQTDRACAQRSRDPLSELACLDGLFVCSNVLKRSKDMDRYSQEAVKVARQLNASEPRVVNATLNRAIAHALAGRFSHALECLDGVPSGTMNRWRAGLVRADVLLEMGDSAQAAQEADRAIFIADTVGAPAVNRHQLRHTRALCHMDCGNLETATAELLETVRGYGQEDAPALALNALVDLSKSYARQNDSLGVLGTEERASTILLQSPCQLATVDIARLAVMDGLVAGLDGNLRRLDRRIRLVNSLLQPLNRTVEAKRSTDLILAFAARHGGQGYHRRSDFLGTFLDSAFVSDRKFQEPFNLTLSVHVLSVGTALSPGINSALLQQAATTPMTRAASHIHLISLRQSNQPHSPQESQVLRILRAYSLYLQSEDYREVIVKLKKARGIIFDYRMTEALVGLHAGEGDDPSSFGGLHERSMFLQG